MTEFIEEQQRKRKGEVAVDVPLQRNAGLIYIGRIITPFKTLYDCPRQGDAENGPLCEIEIFSPWEGAIEGIEVHDRLEIFYWLNRSRRDLIKQSPGKSDKVLSTFTLRSPIRPNPIGVSVVALERVEKNRLFVRGLDCVHDTPLIDIKPLLKAGAKFSDNSKLSR